MERSEEIISLILNTLTIQKESMSIMEIADLTGVHRNVLAKYIKVLEGQGKIEVSHKGTKKYIQLSQRIPGSFLKIITTHPFFITNKYLSIIETGNNFFELYHKEEIISDRNTSLTDFEGLFFTDDVKKALTLAISGEKSTYKLEIFHQSSSHFYFLTFLPIVLDNGRVGAGVIVQDISEKEQLIKNVELINAAYHDLMENQIQYLVRFKPDNRIFSANRIFIQHTGISEQNLSGSLFIPTYPKESFDSAITQLSSISENNPIISLDLRRIDANGDYSWERWKIHGIYDKETGILSEYSAIGLDITELKRAEQEYQHFQKNLESLIISRTSELRELNSELVTEINRRENIERELRVTKFVMDSAKDYIFLLNSEGDIKYMNIRAKEILSPSKNEVINIRSIISNDPSSGMQNPFSFSLEEIVNFGIPIINGSIQQVNKKIIPIEITMNKIVEQGNVVFCCIARDITDRKIIEADLFHYRKHLEQIIDERTKRLHSEIEERKKIENRLRNCEERYRLIADDSDEMVFIYQIDKAEFFDLNSRAEIFFSIDRGDVNNSIQEKLLQIRIENGENILDFFITNFQNMKSLEERIFNIRIDIESELKEVKIQFKGVISNNNRYIRIGITEIISAS